MIVKIIPETDAEKQKMKPMEHTGVKEFMIFGNKKDSDGLVVDFHEWTGRYRYLIGSLSFFEEVLHDERRERDAQTREQESYKSIMNNKNRQGINPSAPKTINIESMPSPAPAPLTLVPSDQAGDDGQEDN